MTAGSSSNAVLLPRWLRSSGGLAIGSALLCGSLIVIAIKNRSAGVRFNDLTSRLDSMSTFNTGLSQSEPTPIVRWVQEHLQPPSTEPYKLGSQGAKRETLPDHVRDYSQFEQMARIIPKYLQNKTNGKFIEVGAHDGEWLSNSLVLERFYNWTGLLVEPNKGPFEKLMNKNRKAYKLNACLANVENVTYVNMSPDGTGSRVNSKSASGTITMTPCVPLSAVFDALSWYHWDFMTLDVEGYESYVLQSIPWTRAKVDVFQIECNDCDKPTGREQKKRNYLKMFMETAGYVEAEFIRLDLIYVRKELMKDGKMIPLNQ